MNWLELFVIALGDAMGMDLRPFAPEPTEQAEESGE